MSNLKCKITANIDKKLDASCEIFIPKNIFSGSELLWISSQAQPKFAQTKLSHVF